MTHKALNNLLWKKKHGTTFSIKFIFIFKFWHALFTSDLIEEYMIKLSDFKKKKSVFPH